MALYSIYELATGNILRSGEHPDLDLLREHLAEGQALYAGQALDDTCWRIVDGLPATYAPPVDLAVLEKELFSQIDLTAEGIRGEFITNTASQPVVYLAKETEANALLANPDLSPDLTPNLTLEAQRTGETRIAVAEVILNKAQMWRQVSAQIENVRLAAKEAVRVASTVEEKRAAAEVDWSPILALRES